MDIENLGDLFDKSKNSFGEVPSSRFDSSLRTPIFPPPLTLFAKRSLILLSVFLLIYLFVK